MVTLREDEREGFEDILGSGGIFRKVLKPSEGEQAEFGEEVSVKYSERTLETDAVVSEDQTRKFRIGDGEVMPALELAAKLMRVGEICEVRCDPRFAYGDVGLEPHVPAGTAMKLLIELCRVGKRVTADMNSSELIEEATKKKDSGNRYFKDKNYEQAAKLYKRALKILEMWEHTEEDAAKCKDLLIALGNNVANVQQRLKQYTEARQSSLEVLQLDGRNIKAMYRVAQIALETSEFAEATEFLSKALEIEPGNSKIRELLLQVKKKKQERKALERKLYSKLGGSKKNANSEQAADQAVEAGFSLRQWMRANVPIVSTVFTAIIAMLMYEFVGKRFLNMQGA